MSGSLANLDVQMFHNKVCKYQGSYGVLKILFSLLRRPFCFLLIKKNAQGCQSGIRLILVQDMLEHQNHKKDLVLRIPQVHG